MVDTKPIWEQLPQLLVAWPTNLRCQRCKKNYCYRTAGLNGKGYSILEVTKQQHASTFKSSRNPECWLHKVTSLTLKKVKVKKWPQQTYLFLSFAIFRPLLSTEQVNVTLVLGHLTQHSGCAYCLIAGMHKHHHLRQIFTFLTQFCTITSKRYRNAFIPVETVKQMQNWFIEIFDGLRTTKCLWLQSYSSVSLSIYPISSNYHMLMWYFFTRTCYLKRGASCMRQHKWCLKVYSGDVSTIWLTDLDGKVVSWALHDTNHG